MTTRRRFLLTLAGGMTFGRALLAQEKKQEKGADDDLASARAAKVPNVSKAKKPLKVLLLGGTGFIGPHIVAHSIARGHAVTLFNRGKTHPELFPDLEKLRGDRDGKLDALKGRKWDAVVDTSGYVPRIVKMSADLLAPEVGANEETPVQELKEPGSEEVRKHYGALKALCERTVEQSMPGRATTIRPGLIVGPGDPTDRYTYWPVRIDRGGEALAPGTGDDPVQYVDARDLAAFVVNVIENGTMGVYNATGPEKQLPMKTMLESSRKASASPATLTWVPEPFLEEHKVSPWEDMPVWTGKEAGFSQIDCKKAIGKGLKFRSADETARDTLAWWKTLPEERRAKVRAGLSPDREKEVLAAWKAKKG